MSVSSRILMALPLSFSLSIYLYLFPFSHALFLSLSHSYSSLSLRLYITLRCSLSIKASRSTSPERVMLACTYPGKSQTLDPILETLYLFLPLSFFLLSAFVVHFSFTHFSLASGVLSPPSPEIFALALIFSHFSSSTGLRRRSYRKRMTTSMRESSTPSKQCDPCVERLTHTALSYSFLFFLLRVMQ
jgi:hypothetical protein